MRCPLCNGKNISASTARGFSVDPLHECNTCRAVWLERNGNKVILVKSKGAYAKNKEA